MTKYQLANAEFVLYRDVFPWFGAAMSEAACTKPKGDRTEAEEGAIQAVLDRARDEWTRLTRLPSLHEGEIGENWLVAARAAGVKEPERADFDRLAREIRRWAVSLQAKAARRQQAEYVFSPDRPTTRGNGNALRYRGCS